MSQWIASSTMLLAMTPAFALAVNRRRMFYETLPVPFAGCREGIIEICTFGAEQRACIAPLRMLDYAIICITRIEKKNNENCVDR